MIVTTNPPDDADRFDQPDYPPVQTGTVEYNDFQLEITEYAHALRRTTYVVAHDTHSETVIKGWAYSQPVYQKLGLSDGHDSIRERLLTHVADTIDTYRTKEADTTLEEQASTILSERNSP